MGNLSFNTLIENFRKVVEESRAGEALKFNDKVYTYDELDKWSDYVAGELAEYGVSEGDGVGVIASRCPAFVVAILGIIKAGSFCIPINQDEAYERTEFLIKDSAIKVTCLTSEEYSYRFEGTEMVVVDEYRDLCSSKEPLTREPCSQVYRIYTSGTTGYPKGCDLSNSNMLNLLESESFKDIGREHRVLQTFSPGFDGCAYEVWETLLSGGCLVFTDKVKLLGAETIKEVFKKEDITAVFLPTSLFHQLCEQDYTIFDSLYHIMIGGSALSVSHVKKVKTFSPHIDVTNVYGPTENTVMTTCHLVEDRDFERVRLPVGRALKGVGMVLMDKNLKPVKNGETGELCVSGGNLCNGYFNRDSLNREKFFDFQGARWYRTGDLVREIEPGLYDCLGRFDDQIKLNGYRIELTEIEHVIKEIDGVDNALVKARDLDGNKQLVAYYSGPTEEKQAALKEKLGKRLSQYMIPARWMKVNPMPLTMNGKVDFRKLEEFDRKIDEQEQKVLKEIEEVKGIKAFSGTEIGRAGLTQDEALKIAGRLRITLNEFFHNGSVRELAQVMWEKERSGAQKEGGSVKVSSELDQLLKDF